MHKLKKLEELTPSSTCPFPLGVHATNPEVRKTILEPVFPLGKSCTSRDFLVPTWMFSWVLSLILNPAKTISFAQRQGKQKPSPILEEIPQSKWSPQKKPAKPALKKGGICLAYNIQCKHRMHVFLVAKYDFDTLLNLFSSIFADGFFYHRKHSLDRSLSGHLPAERTRGL